VIKLSYYQTANPGLLAGSGEKGEGESPVVLVQGGHRHQQPAAAHPASDRERCVTRRPTASRRNSSCELGMGRRDRRRPSCFQSWCKSPKSRRQVT